MRDSAAGDSRAADLIGRRASCRPLSYETFDGDRVELGYQTVAVRADLQDAYGATRDEAVTQLEAAIEKWVKDQTPST